MTAYEKKLKTYDWLQFREFVLFNRPTCEECHTKQSLEIHHCVYLPRRKPWEHSMAEVMTLCRWHHSERQPFEDMARIYLGRLMRLMTTSEVEELAWGMAERHGHRQIENQVRAIA